jgi:1-acyl-sn-glycerol-3-phosphate acyltransferase
LTCVAVRQLLFPLWVPEVSGLEHVPLDGPVILVCNHPTLLEPLVTAATLPRFIDFVISEKVARIPLVGPWLIAIGSIVVGRGSTLEEVAQRLSGGGCVGLCPEGILTHQDHLGPFQSGVAVLAQRTGAPVVPLGFSGTRPLLERHASCLGGGPIRLSFGPPLRCRPDEPLADFLDRLRCALQDQMGRRLPPLHRGWRYRLAQAFWQPPTWLLFKLIDWLRPEGLR